MKFKFLNIIWISLILSASCLVNNANAGLIQDGEIITDTETNNEWFTLTSTLGFSYNEMLLNFMDINSKFYGFSYATFSDLETLINGQGYTGNYAMPDYNSGNMSAAQLLLTTFGQTGSNVAARSDGMFQTDSVGFANWLVVLPSYNWNGPGATAVIAYDATGWGPHRAVAGWGNGNDMGSWIFKADEPITGTANVPEPSTLAIFALGMIGLASRRFKKQP
ncbi:MAG: PEP-CTERM sorting domain-containing protein [Colwellia sp.]|nr:PEP-CTERM sorting domain-containing protein [Colwellia sp.]